MFIFATITISVVQFVRSVKRIYVSGLSCPWDSNWNKGWNELDPYVSKNLQLHMFI